jgi:hypothetical protein
LPGEDGCDPVADSRPVVDEAGAVRRQPAQPPGRLVGLPHRRQVVGGQELGERGRGDRLRAQGVGDDDAARMAAQQVGQGPGIGRCLEGDRVVRFQGRRERPEVVHRDPGQSPGRAAAVDDRDVGEVAADVETDEAHGVAPL